MSANSRSTTGSRTSKFSLVGLAGVALVAALASVVVRADSAQPMVFDHLQIEDGLSQGTVTKVHQDRQGFIWIATESGLNRFDGVTIQRFGFDRADAGALQNDYIWDLAEDRDGQLWMATNGAGIARFDADTQSFIHYRHDSADTTTLSSDVARSIEIDESGQIWVGTRDAGLNRMDPETGVVERIQIEGSGSSISSTATIFDITEATDGSLWLASNEGLFRLSPDRTGVRQYRHNPDNPRSLSQDTVIAVHQTSDGIIWAGTFDAGLNRLVDPAGTFIRFQAGDGETAIAGNFVRDILEDGANRLWIATSAGLSLLDRTSSQFQNYQHDPAVADSLGNSFVMTLFEDRSGVLWLGTRGAGISHWNPRSWSLGLTRPPGFAGRQIVSFADDRNGHVWIGTMGDGLYRYNLETGESQSASDAIGVEIDISRAMSLLIDQAGDLWIGTMTAGVHRVSLANGQITVFRNDPDAEQSLSADGVMSLHEDNVGGIWVGTFGGGINRIDLATQSVERIVIDGEAGDALASSRVTAISEGPNGFILIATDGDGLFIYDRGTGIVRQYVTDMDDATTIQSDSLYSIDFDSIASRLMVGSGGRGIDYATLSTSLDTLEFRNFSKSDGLGDNVVYGIHSVADGSVWLSGNSGLTRVVLESGEVRQFHTRHGLQGEEFNFGAHHMAADGYLYFGGTEGFNRFLPTRVEATQVAPQSAITAIDVDNTPMLTLAKIGSLQLSHDAKAITAKVAVLDFVEPESNSVFYQLDGFDPQWYETDPGARITYTNLDPGDYRLRLRGVNSEGVSSSDVLELAVRVSAAPWQTWYAYLFYVVLLSSFVWLSTWWYRNKVERDAYIERLAQSDPVTGLANRSHFKDQLRHTITIGRKTGEHIALMMLQFSHLRGISDDFGHQSSDNASKAIANSLIHTVGEIADQHQYELGSLANDEFVVMLAGPNASLVAEQLSERIAAQMVDIRMTVGTRRPMGVSIGVARFGEHGGDADTLLSNARIAASVARTDGADSIVEFSPVISARKKARLKLEADLRQAIADNALHVHLQPKFRIHDAQLVGAEALVRWEHPERGMIPPNEFIPVAEEIGLIGELDRFVARASARLIREWQDRALPLIPIAVNFSSVEFVSGSPAEELSRIARDAGIDPRYLHLEITESHLMMETEQTMSALQDLRALGSKVFVDDFGTGYSSLAYLKRFPLDCVKLDQSFVSEIATSEEDRYICTAIIAMAHSLDLKVVAEGVETQEQWDCVAELGCDQAQGYLMGKPVQSDMFDAHYNLAAYRDNTGILAVMA
ncbi:MAG: EAL domain-containing protein, partial [Pseudomonadota bacterium]